jgi:acetoacetyl-CoA synthetase
VDPLQQADLSRLRAVGSAGSLLSGEADAWLSAQTPRPGGGCMWINAISSGTDFGGAFVAGNRELPLHQAEVGELVCTKPIRSG